VYRCQHRRHLDTVEIEIIHLTLLRKLAIMQLKYKTIQQIQQCFKGIGTEILNSRNGYGTSSSKVFGKRSKLKACLLKRRRVFHFIDNVDDCFSSLYFDDFATNTKNNTDVWVNANMEVLIFVIHLAYIFYAVYIPRPMDVNFIRK